VAKLEEVYATGLVQRADLEGRCMEQLQNLPEHLALEICTKFSEVPPHLLRCLIFSCLNVGRERGRALRCVGVCEGV